MKGGHLRDRRQQTPREILVGQFEVGLKLPVTYHVVVAFDRDEEGELKPRGARKVMSPIVAERRARALALEHAGALALFPARISVSSSLLAATMIQKSSPLDRKSVV